MGKRAQHSEIGFPISTDDASWGNGPNIVKLDPQFLLTLQVGGPNIVKLDPQFLLTLQVGGPNTEAGGKSASMNIIKKLGNKMLPNFIFKIIKPI
ncbi:hypothetical protein DB782_10585 [Staphylococcus aureus]|uniref:hypothetical protein n=1 Tax=Staphylococcus aureus TaxID=1280 RepID=UPI000E3DB24A|nr:hypothetical protein [Staphylococcus aureus]RQX49426.1 hypothetical protein DB782_10585 [Staphylococcus aureus]HCX9579094.1 hypothetical protein [Staphylococcus aureus]HDA7709700.1 hypothetical protein [Staphylococcus aureus]HDF8648389.1 hypothetical protein [Staphylococcus aureus]HDP1934451.1 hypothetical protein [Staphylococcus aureus]